MKTELEKMLAGEHYDPRDGQLSRLRGRCRALCRRLNDGDDDSPGVRRPILEELFGCPTDAWVEPPFHCDYGTNIVLGSNVYLNCNCVVLDVMKVEIGSHVLIGPAVQIYTAMHPLDAAARREGKEYAMPVTIGCDVWIGGGVIVCPGVSIGDRSVVGAGSVVTRSLPADVLAAGNPCRVIRPLVAENRGPVPPAAPPS